MAGQYDNTNRGVLWRQKDKRNPKGPDWKGEINIDGTVYKIVGWGKHGSGQNGAWENINITRDMSQAPPKSYPRDVTPPVNKDGGDVPW